MQILFLSRWFPYPTDNGSKLRIYHLLRGLADVHEVHLLSFADDPATAEKEQLARFCRSVQVVPWKVFQPDSRKALIGFLNPMPRSLVDIYSTEMERKIQCSLQEHTFDLVITSEWQVTAYRHLFANLPVLFEELEVGVPYGQFTQATSGITRLRAGLTWLKQRRYLSRLLSNGQPCTVVSERERALLLAISPDSPIYVIPNGVDLDAYAGVQGTPEPDSLIFTGSFRYQPNYQAMLWFIERVLPQIKEQVPGVRLTITGDPAGLSLPRDGAVTQTGFVADVRPLVARSWVSIVPLQVGGGTRLKILEAAALGTPVVSTSKGAEGLAFEDGRDIAIADTPSDFANRTVRLLNDRELRGRMTANARALARQVYDWKVILPDFLKVVEQAVAPGKV